MPKISQSFFKAAAVFLILSVGIGLQMSISGVHDVTGAHVHVGLLGWVACAAFGAYYGLAPDKAALGLAWVQFWLIVIAALAMNAALYLLLLDYSAAQPVVAAGSLLYAVGCLIFLWIVFRADS